MRKPKDTTNPFWIPLKGCPFCGRKPEREEVFGGSDEAKFKLNLFDRFDRIRIRCNNNKCLIKPETSYYRTYNIRRLVNAWNKRFEKIKKEQKS